MKKKLSVFEILSLRYQFCEIVKRYNIPSDVKEGDVSGLRWFVRNSYRSNRFKANRKEAIEIAELILENV